jgi:hypothetical protein
MQKETKRQIDNIDKKADEEPKVGKGKFIDCQSKTPKMKPKSCQTKALHKSRIEPRTNNIRHLFVEFSSFNSHSIKLRPGHVL